MLNFLQFVGAGTIDFCQRVGQSGLFLISSILRVPHTRMAWQSLSIQLYRVGILSLAIIILSGLFIGMVVALQGYNTLQKFAAEQELGQLLTLSVTRELGPVVTALLFAGRAGSALTAEIGLMRATDQISCMEMMAVDPLAQIISPRFWAGIISMPILAILFDVVAVYGGHMVGVEWLGVDNGSFWSNMQAAVDFRADIVSGLIKSLVFGFVVVWIALYQGYYSEPNSQGISRATTNTVVYASLMVLALDFVLTAVMMGGW